MGARGLTLPDILALIFLRGSRQSGLGGLGGLGLRLRYAPGLTHWLTLGWGKGTVLAHLRSAGALSIN